jgi:hypothetical protein
MICRVGDCVRRGDRSCILKANDPDFQPTLVAFLFSSVYTEVESLPPPHAPRYGWWQEAATAAGRLWQHCTKDLNYEITGNFDPDLDIATILNRNTSASRASYISTVFYMYQTLQTDSMDAVLTDLLLEQLVDDLDRKEVEMLSGTWSRQLWFWSVMFGAAVVATGRITNPLEEKRLQEWRALYAEKLKLVSGLMELDSWEKAKLALAKVAWTERVEIEDGLRIIWEAAVL